MRHEQYAYVRELLQRAVTGTAERAHVEALLMAVRADAVMQHPHGGNERGTMLCDLADTLAHDTRSQGLLFDRTREISRRVVRWALQGEPLRAEVAMPP